MPQVRRRQSYARRIILKSPALISGFSGRDHGGNRGDNFLERNIWKR
jgi:hypothetical protein